ncbi:MAG: TonB-dependent receptor [Bacteroides sp.]|nr:TonB-dependent receptor [Bacteroides sp.]
MKRNSILMLLVCATATLARAEEYPKDSLRIVDMEEVMVIASPKENRKLREQPTSVTLLSQQDMQANQVISIKGLTSVVPNLFIPDYGSKLTSAIYIRGIGSRINTPSVGLYVDNIPYIDKSAFDFNYNDIERIEVLRGPQGTLYGRNTMGGLIRVHTKSPFSYQGTDLQLGAGSYNRYNGSVTHYHRISDTFAFSAGGFYEHEGGFFKNAARDNERIDKVNAGGGRIRGIYLPTENLKLDLNISYEYSDQGGYPYGLYDPETKKTAQPAYNDKSSYYRGLFNTGLNIGYQAQHFTLNAATGFQDLKDRMFIDQDFSPKDIYNIEQKQKLKTLSEEIVLKSKPGRRWQWTTGVFGFYQWLSTNGPVLFKEEGVKDMLESNINSYFPDLSSMNMDMSLEINSPEILVTGTFDTPVFNFAVYHQSTIQDLFTKGLSATVGLRLDYEKNSMKYHSGSEIDYDFSLTSPMMPIHLELKDAPLLEGKLKNDYVQLLPKFSLQYDFNPGNNIYVNVAKGYRSGGYNIQMFSDLIQNCMQNDMQENINTNVSEILDQYAEQGMPDRVIEMIKSNLPEVGDAPDIKASTVYKPEYSWNYEIGSHLTLSDRRVWLDLSAFYMDTRDQQISRFAKSGMGRITVNAGKSHSYGAEAALRSMITDAFGVNLSYGYTHSTFRDYETAEYEETELADEDSELRARTNYKGNYVPFVPQHTLNVGAHYTWTLGTSCWLDQIRLDANYSGAGKIYWTESNQVKQNFYGTLNGVLNFIKGGGQIDFWVRNALNAKYNTFYFESMGNGFAQKGRPVHFGMNLRCRF